MKNDPQDFHFHLNTLLRRATGRFPADDLDAEIGAILSALPAAIDHAIDVQQAAIRNRFYETPFRPKLFWTIFI
jgi:hypothetical protein